MVEGFSHVTDRFEETDVALGHLQDDIHSIKYDLKELRSEVTEMRSEIKAHGKAIDMDAVTLINHERRIAKLEKAPQKTTV